MDQNGPSERLALADQLGLDEAFLAPVLQELKQTGLIQEIGGRWLLADAAYTLTPSWLTAFSPDIEWHYQPEVDSTNAWAIRTAASRSMPANSVFLARTQTAGRGRRGRTWVSPEGSLCFSLAMRHQLGPERLVCLPLVTGLAVAETLDSFGVKCQVKWPNDLLYSDKKIAGILLETALGFDKMGYVILGIGLNLNNHPETDGFTAISLSEILGRDRVPGLILSEMIDEILKRFSELQEYGFRNLQADYLKRMARLGETVRVAVGDRIIEGQNIGINELGNLLIRHRDQTMTTVHTGDVLW